jgi:F0F1-type ATP synthase membrane subunit b/b'
MCVSLTVLVIAFKKRFIPRINKMFASRDQHLKKYSEMVEKLKGEIEVVEEGIEKLHEKEAKRAAEIVREAIKKSEATLAMQLNIVKEENEGRVNATRDRLSKEIGGLESVFKMQIEMAAQAAFEQIFLGKS